MKCIYFSRYPSGIASNHYYFFLEKRICCKTAASLINYLFVQIFDPAFTFFCYNKEQIKHLLFRWPFYELFSTISKTKSCPPCFCSVFTFSSLHPAMQLHISIEFIRNESLILCLYLLYLLLEYETFLLHYLIKQYIFYLHKKNFIFSFIGWCKHTAGGSRSVCTMMAQKTRKRLQVEREILFQPRWKK